MTQDDDFLEVIAAEVAQDPSNTALREDFVTLLLRSDRDRAADEVAAFEAHGGDPSRVRLLRARVMAARLRGPQAGSPSEAAPTHGSTPTHGRLFRRTPGEPDREIAESLADWLWDRVVAFGGDDPRPGRGAGRGSTVTTA